MVINTIFIFREINIRLLKENIELFFKKDSNFKRPLKTDVIYAKLTKGFVPHYEWNGHRRRIPWKVLKKDQTVNKFPSGLLTILFTFYLILKINICIQFFQLSSQLRLDYIKVYNNCTGTVHFLCLHSFQDVIK